MVDTGSHRTINSLKRTFPKPSKVFVATLSPTLMSEMTGYCGAESVGHGSMVLIEHKDVVLRN